MAIGTGHQLSRRKVLGWAAVAGTAPLLVHCATSSSTHGGEMKLGTPGPRIQQLADELTRGATTERERALRLYTFVRDEIAFGFTKAFDTATPEQTLESRRGHCNPQATLFVALLRAAGLEARPYFVTLRRDILDGLFPSSAQPPELISHSFTEVKLQGRWVAVDGYILDPPFHQHAVRLLKERGQQLGLGAHVEGRINWDGESPCMSQYVSTQMAVPGGDHGPFEEAERFYESEAYAQRLNVFTRLLFGRFAVGPANVNIESIRTGKAPA